MPNDTDRLKAKVRSRGKQLGAESNAEVATKSGVKLRTLNNILSGKPSRDIHTLEDWLGWRYGSVATVLAGGDPTLATLEARPPPTLDATDGCTVRKAIEIDPALTPEEKRALLRHYFGLLEFARQRERSLDSLDPFDPERAGPYLVSDEADVLPRP